MLGRLQHRAEISPHSHEGFVALQSFSLTHTLNPICLDQDPNPLSPSRGDKKTVILYICILIGPASARASLYVVMYVLLVV